MFPKRTFVAALVLAFTLAGCSSIGDGLSVSQYKAQFAGNPPSTEWLEKETQALREKAWAEPTKSNVEVFAFVSSELDKRLEVEERDEEWYSQTHRLLTVAWGNKGRGGAAFRQPAYIHVLANDQPTLTTRQHAVPLLNTGTLVSSSFDKLHTLKAGSYSMYELSRWERYCNGGKGMDKRDWDFVRKEGTANIPLALLGKCNPPTATR